MLQISIWNNGNGWSACRGEYDLGKLVFSGRTQREAIDDLLDNYTFDDGTVLS